MLFECCHEIGLLTMPTKACHKRPPPYLCTTNVWGENRDQIAP
jgi:hypothetical protein